MRKFLVVIAVLVGFTGAGLSFFWNEQPKQSEESTYELTTDLPVNKQPVAHNHDAPYGEILALSAALQMTGETAKVETAKTPFAKARALGDVRQQFETFSNLARTHASAIDANGGPADLACIFRGMALDAENKLELLRTASTMGEQAPVWADAVYLFADLPSVLNLDQTTNPKQNPDFARTCPVATEQD